MAGVNVANGPAGATITIADTSTMAFPSVNGGSTRGLLSPYGSTLSPAARIPYRITKIRAVVMFSPGASGTQTPFIYWNSGANTDLTTFTGDVNLAIADGNVFSTPLIFSTNIEFTWDPVSKRLTGWSHKTVGPQSEIWRALPNVATPTNPEAMSFFVAAAFGTANAANSATLLEFAMDCY